ncbi:MAG: hypothetical protein QXD73_05255 [Candidatus Bathyarchaeia archaeon]
MCGVKIGYRGKEIDFLAVDIKNEKRIHVEVHASVSPLAPLRLWGSAKYGKLPIEDRVRYCYYDKFVGATEEGTSKLLNRRVEETALEKFDGKNYEKWLVFAQLHPKDNS